MLQIAQRVLLSLAFLVVVSVYGQETVSGDGSKNIIIEPVTGSYSLSEGPHWDHLSQKLYFVDIIGQKLCRLDTATGIVTSTTIDIGRVGVAIPVDGQPNTFVAGAGKYFVLVNWNSDDNSTKAATKVLATVGDDVPNIRWNDGKADSSGRFWGGTMAQDAQGAIAPNKGSFYRIDSDIVPKKELSNVSISNGIAWNSIDDVMYYIDSPTRQIVAYKFDPQLGTISDKTVAFDLKKHNISGVPDGMTIDTDDNIWFAVFGGGCVVNADPKTGELLRIVNMPATDVTSVTFGGPLLDILYVTTSSYNLSVEALKGQPHAGSVFSVKGLGVRGVIANKFKLNP